MRKISLLLVDDHPIVGLGVETLLKAATDFEWLGISANAAEAVVRAGALQPGVIVLDLMLGGRDGLELIAGLLQTAPSTRIVIFSALDEKVYALRAFTAGASGYVMKESGFPALLKAIRSVATGEPFASDRVKQALLESAVGRRLPASTTQIEQLSNQELCVFRLLGSGMGSADIATQLGISPKTVSTHRERIKNKLGIHTARELESRAEQSFREGFAEAEWRKREC